MADVKAAVAAHPAGTFAGAGGVVAGYLISITHLSPEATGAIVAGLGLLTTGISWVVAHGGIRGLARDILSGKS